MSIEQTKYNPGAKRTENLRSSKRNKEEQELKKEQVPWKMEKGSRKA